MTKENVAGASLDAVTYREAATTNIPRYADAQHMRRLRAQALRDASNAARNSTFEAAPAEPRRS